MTTSAPTAPPTTAPTAGSVDRHRAIATLVAAFTGDPVIRWIFPDPVRHLTGFPQLLTLLGSAAFDRGSADCAEDYAGAALWMPPDVEPDVEAVGALFHRTVDPDRHGEVFTLLEQVGAHHPDEACWYLPFIGVDPRCQRQGHGSRILAQGLARCDRDGLPAYLEASSPGNRDLYIRHGFAVQAEIRAGDSPPLWPMLRPAR